MLTVAKPASRANVEPSTKVRRRLHGSLGSGLALATHPLAEAALPHGQLHQPIAELGDRERDEQRGEELPH